MTRYSTESRNKIIIQRIKMGDKREAIAIDLNVTKGVVDHVACAAIKSKKLRRQK